MNCKPGDLAVIVRAPFDKEHLGKIVKCIGFSSNYESHWITEPKLPRIGGGWLSWADKNLRPIRDPGEDAIDETIARIGKPATINGKKVNIKPYQFEEFGK